MGRLPSLDSVSFSMASASICVFALLSVDFVGFALPGDAVAPEPPLPNTIIRPIHSGVSEEGDWRSFPLTRLGHGLLAANSVRYEDVVPPQSVLLAGLVCAEEDRGDMRGFRLRISPPGFCGPQAPVRGGARSRYAPPPPEPQPQLFSGLTQSAMASGADVRLRSWVGLTGWRTAQPDGFGSRRTGCGGVFLQEINSHHNFFCRRPGAAAPCVAALAGQCGAETRGDAGGVALARAS